ncbi:MAG: ATP-binding protein [Candidatus Omnitrophota bacterium]
MIIERELYSKIKLYLKSPEAIIVTGMRRVGKTTLLRYIFERIVSDNKLMLDLENPIVQKYFEEEDYERIKLNLEIAGINFTKKAYVFLDEIQYVKTLPNVVKYLHDHYEVKFFLTGSSSFYLKKVFTESLSGRKYIFELYPLNFMEFLKLKNKKIMLPEKLVKISENIVNSFSTLYEEYLLFGGFPGVVIKESFEEKKMALEDIFSSYFQLEIANLGDFRNLNIVRDLILLLMQRTGAKLDIQKLSRILGVSRSTIYEYVSFLEGTYFIKLVKPFTKNRDVEIRNASKVYFCDSGLLNNLTRVDEGALFENNVFQNLNLKGELNYYQKKSGVEIDFILNKEEAIEVKIKPTRQDLQRLKRVSEELDIKKAYIVSKKYSTLDDVKYGFLL